MLKLNKQDIKVIAFDADDTLWVNETHYRYMEDKFAELLQAYGNAEEMKAELLKTEIKNLELYGFGAKAFVLSNIETLIRIAGKNTTVEQIEALLHLGKQLIDAPMQLLPHVSEVLQSLSGKFKLVVATKGDLLDQERKLRKSGLEKYFHHIEIMSDKQMKDYTNLLDRLECNAENMLMIGNSMKSDIIPVLELGGYGMYIPFHTLWAHEKVDDTFEHPRMFKATDLRQIFDLIEI